MKELHLEGATINRLLLSHGVALVHELELALRPRLYLVVLDDVLGHVLLHVLLRLREGARLMLLRVSRGSFDVVRMRIERRRLVILRLLGVLLRRVHFLQHHLVLRCLRLG